MSEIKVLIFDFDDTIVHTGIDFKKLKQNIVDSITDEGYDSLIKSINPLTIANMLEAIKKKDDRLYNELMVAVNFFESKAVETAYMNPKYLNLLKSLKTSYKISLLTNNSQKAVDILLEKFAIKNIFHLVLTREDVPILKPDPSGLNKVLDFFRVDKNSALFIGDSYVDMLAGKAAGIRFIGVGKRWDGQDRSYKDNVDDIIDDLTGLLPLLNEKYNQRFDNGY